MTPEIKQRIQQIRQGKIPKGYKKTNVGIIPNEWLEIALSNLLEFKNGYNTEKDNYGKGVKLISIRDILKDKPIYYDSIIGSVSIFDEQLTEFAVNYGDILFQRSSETYEDAGTSNVYLDKEKVASFSGFVIRGRKIADYDPICLNSILRLGKIRNSIIRKAAGAQHINIGQEALSKVQIPLPPLPEQTAIAEILSTQDRVIELKEQLLAEKKRQKKYLMQQLLTGKMRLKGFKGEWKKCRLGEVAKFSKGYGYSKSDISINGEIPIILYGRLYTNYKTIIKDIDTYTNTKIRNAVFSKGNEVIVPASGETAEDIAIASCIEPEGVILGGDLNIIYPNETILPSYLANLISYGPLHLELSKKAQGKSVVHLHNDDLSNVIIEFPPLPEQTAIAEILSTADREIELLGQSIEAEKRKKKSLMQLLLTGIVRVEGMERPSGAQRPSPG